MSGSEDSRLDPPPFEHIDVPRLLGLLFIEAKKKGRAWSAICPSGRHTDKHPSWSIREEPGTKRNGKHHCFSCKYGGTAIDLVSQVLDLSYAGASDFIAERAMLEVHPALNIRIELGSPVIRRRCTMPAGVYFEPLDTWVSQAKRYVTSRGITAEQVNRWGIGYAVDGKLSGRFIIPTRDARGQLLAWTARTYLDSPKRYLAASSDDNPDIDAVFGEQHWGSDPQSVLVITEGAINALAVERVCPDALVGALSGSHIEPGHAMKLSRHRMIVILTDPDHAGDHAAEQLMAMLGRHSSVTRLRLEDREDPANVPPDYLKERLWKATDQVRTADAKRRSA